jgi:hypothetical protein
MMLAQQTKGDAMKTYTVIMEKWGEEMAKRVKVQAIDECEAEAMAHAKMGHRGWMPVGVEVGR